MMLYVNNVEELTVLFERFLEKIKSDKLSFEVYRIGEYLCHYVYATYFDSRRPVFITKIYMPERWQNMENENNLIDNPLDKMKRGYSGKPLKEKEEDDSGAQEEGIEDSV